jgi:hypothetical protein
MTNLKPSYSSQDITVLISNPTYAKLCHEYACCSHEYDKNRTDMECACYCLNEFKTLENFMRDWINQ